MRAAVRKHEMEKWNLLVKSIGCILEKILQHRSRSEVLHTNTQLGQTCLQRHQIASGGVGLITTDEGHRFLASVNAKQLKGESERSYLCKLWSGKGDFVDLSNGSRGFKRTSMSLCLFIQPHPLLSEMACFTGMDGFLDRFLFMVSRPLLFPTKVVKENFAELSKSGMKDFDEVYYKMYLNHQDGKEYYLSEDAQKEYDEMVDSYADLLNDKYMEVSELDEEEKENHNLSATQTNLCMTTSKDTIHVIRLAAALQITSSYIRATLTKTEVVNDTKITVESLRCGRKLYCFMAGQKAVFAQALNTLQQTDSVKLKKVMSFKIRVIKAIVSSEGPVISLRCLQRKLYGSLKDSVIHELEELEREGAGMLHKVGKPRKEIFLKASPGQMPNEILKKVDISVDDYMIRFKSKKETDGNLIMMSLPSHPQHDEIVDWFC
ncbi:uncharacterized protein LOC127733660 [Mytilus californianus]|uniref:uncharacterized protein LOC127733660 n=1 Tax=Mytilus californianus TaxID=6549 RepID=UPI002246A4D6|nr:uncharacterized protein LOC127733660 [Mytilus californianus]